MKKIAALRYYKDLRIWCTITVGVIVLLSCSAERERAVITITNKEIHLDAEGAQSQKIQIISNTEWEIKSNEDNWLYINKEANKGDTATVFITASPNTGLQRSSRISIINEELPEQVITITQDGIRIVPDFEYVDEIDRYRLINKSYSIPSSKELVENWEIVDRKSMIQNDLYTYFMLPATDSRPDSIEVKLTMSSPDCEASTVKHLPLPPLTWYRVYKIGKQVDTNQSNNKNYNWYIDQTNTGTYSNMNCGPTCATMALMWVNKDFNHSAEEARNTYLLNGGAWSTRTIMDYLNKYGANYHVMNFNEWKVNDLIAEINAGNIAILCLDIYYVRTQTKGEQWKLDKFYTTTNKSSGHFILVKGYYVINNTVFFEIYDPWSKGKTYANGLYMGCDRVYRREDIVNATNVWWKYAIIVHPQSQDTRSLYNNRPELQNVPVQFGW